VCVCVCVCVCVRVLVGASYRACCGACVPVCMYSKWRTMVCVVISPARAHGKRPAAALSLSPQAHDTPYPPGHGSPPPKTPGNRGHAAAAAAPSLSLRAPAAGPPLTSSTAQLGLPRERRARIRVAAHRAPGHSRAALSTHLLGRVECGAAASFSRLAAMRAAAPRPCLPGCAGRGRNAGICTHSLTA
jgi:hypothetical protein